MRRIAVTTGEPAGIGPDIAIMLAQSSREDEIVAIGDPTMLQARAKQLDLDLELRLFDVTKDAQNDSAGCLCVLPISTAVNVKSGQLDKRNASYVLDTLDTAVDGCVEGHFAAMVTAPVHKGVINDAGIAFTGHTEYLAERTDSYPVMMLIAGDLRVALATTHLPLSEVASAITQPLLTEVITTMHKDLISRFGIANPRIVVAGLNPHAGEGGHLGSEEINTITPALDALRQAGMQLEGPLPADTLFTPHHLTHADAVLAMYHDQGLPVLKYKGFGEGVNVTLGLPIIRTSVDHGTALDKAGHGNIDCGSMASALSLAQTLAHSSTPSSSEQRIS